MRQYWIFRDKGNAIVVFSYGSPASPVLPSGVWVLCHAVGAPRREAEEGSAMGRCREMYTQATYCESSMGASGANYRSLWSDPLLAFGEGWRVWHGMQSL